MSRRRLASPGRGVMRGRRMPEVQLPLFPAGVTPINDQLAVSARDGQVVYLNGHLPVFTHGGADLAAFRLFTPQLIVNGPAAALVAESTPSAARPPAAPPAAPRFTRSSTAGVTPRPSSPR